MSESREEQALEALRALGKSLSSTWDRASRIRSRIGDVGVRVMDELVSRLSRRTVRTRPSDLLKRSAQLTDRIRRTAAEILEPPAAGSGESGAAPPPPAPGGRPRPTDPPVRTPREPIGEGSGPKAEADPAPTTVEPAAAAGSTSTSAAAPSDPMVLPEAGDSQVLLLARDPEWAYVSWRMPLRAVGAAAAGMRSAEARLRVFAVGDVAPRVDDGVPPSQGQYFFRWPGPGRYWAQLVVRGEGSEVELGRSRRIQAPVPDAAPAEEAEEDDEADPGRTLGTPGDHGSAGPIGSFAPAAAAARWLQASSPGPSSSVEANVIRLPEPRPDDRSGLGLDSSLTSPMPFPGPGVSSGAVPGLAEGAAVSFGGVPTSARGLAASFWGVPTSAQGVVASFRAAPTSARAVAASFWGAPTSAPGVAASFRAVPTSARGVAASFWGAPTSARAAAPSFRGGPTSARALPTSRRGLPASWPQAPLGRGMPSSPRAPAPSSPVAVAPNLKPVRSGGSVWDHQRHLETWSSPVRQTPPAPTQGPPAGPVREDLLLPRLGRALRHLVPASRFDDGE